MALISRKSVTRTWDSRSTSMNFGSLVKPSSMVVNATFCVVGIELNQAALGPLGTSTGAASGTGPNTGSRGRPPFGRAGGGVVATADGPASSGDGSGVPVGAVVPEPSLDCSVRPGAVAAIATTRAATRATMTATTGQRRRSNRVTRAARGFVELVGSGVCRRVKTFSGFQGPPILPHA